MDPRGTTVLDGSNNQGISSTMATNTDGTDSDDLQFVDDLNVDPEPADSSSQPSVTARSPCITSLDSIINRQGEITSLTIGSSECKRGEGVTGIMPLNDESRQMVDTFVPNQTNDAQPGLNSTAPLITAIDQRRSSREETTDNSTDSHQDHTTVNSGLLPKHKTSEQESSTNPHGDAPEILPSFSPLHTIIKHFIEGFVIEESTDPFPVHFGNL